MFGQILNPSDPNDFVSNFSCIGLGGRVSQDEQTTFLHFVEIEAGLEPGSYPVLIWAKVSTENSGNQSILVFNESVDFLEVRDIKTTISVFLIYSFFVGIVATILFLIFTKDKSKSPTQQSSKKVKDYSDIHKDKPVIVTFQRKKKRSSSPGSSPNELNALSDALLERSDSPHREELPDILEPPKRSASSEPKVAPSKKNTPPKEKTPVKEKPPGKEKTERRNVPPPPTKQSGRSQKFNK